MSGLRYGFPLGVVDDKIPLRHRHSEKPRYKTPEARVEALLSAGEASRNRWRVRLPAHIHPLASPTLMIPKSSSASFRAITDSSVRDRSVKSAGLFDNILAQ